MDLMLKDKETGAIGGNSGRTIGALDFGLSKAKRVLYHLSQQVLYAPGGIAADDR